MEEEKQFHQPGQEDFDKGAKPDWDGQTQMLKKSSAKYSLQTYVRREKSL